MSHKVVSPAWIAEQAGVSARTVQRAAAGGAIKAPRGKAKYQRRYLLTTELQNWIDQKRSHRKGSLPKASTRTKRRWPTMAQELAFPVRSARKWIAHIRRQLRRDSSGRIAQALVNTPEAQEMAFYYFVALLRGRAARYGKALTLSRTEFEQMVGDEFGKTFAMKVATFLQQVKPIQDGMGRSWASF